MLCISNPRSFQLNQWGLLYAKKHGERQTDVKRNRPMEKERDRLWMATIRQKAGMFEIKSCSFILPAQSWVTDMILKDMSLFQRNPGDQNILSRLLKHVCLKTEQLPGHWYTSA